MCHSPYRSRYRIRLLCVWLRRLWFHCVNISQCRVERFTLRLFFTIFRTLSSTYIGNITFTVLKRSCEKVMFLHPSVSHSVHRGCLPQCMLGYTPMGRHHPADGYCCGRYASYWNAFLFEIFLTVTVTLTSLLIHYPVEMTQ